MGTLCLNFSPGPFHQLGQFKQISKWSHITSLLETSHWLFSSLTAKASLYHRLQDTPTFFHCTLPIALLHCLPGCWGDLLTSAIVLATWIPAMFSPNFWIFSSTSWIFSVVPFLTTCLLPLPCSCSLSLFYFPLWCL